MTPEQIAEGRRLLDEADPAPWHLVMRPVTTIVDDDGMGICQPFSHNAELIVWARNNLPALLDALDDAECESERLRLRLSRLRSPKRARQTLDSTGDANRQRRPHARTSTPANEPACPSLEDLERARATIDRVLKLIDDAEQSPSRGVQFGGTPFPASVGTDQLRAALDGDQ